MSSSPSFFLVGDFNIDFLVPSTSLYFKLLSVVSSFNLSQIVSEPTRVSSSLSTLIDLIFVSSIVSVQSCVTVPPLANADHFGLQLVFTTSHPKRCKKSSTRRVWQYSLADFDRAAELLDSVDWDSISCLMMLTLIGRHGKTTSCRSWISVFPTVWSRLRGIYPG